MLRSIEQKRVYQQFECISYLDIKLYAVVVIYWLLSKVSSLVPFVGRHSPFQSLGRKWIRGRI